MKVSKESVQYRKATDQDKRCGACSMYRAGGECTAVRGSIKPSDTCRLWEKKRT